MEGSAFVLYDSNMRQADGSRIQVYNLFGEMGDLPDVVHCETIAARSALHDWAVSPHRHARLHQILLIEKGGGRASFDGRIVPLGPMRVVNVPVGSVHGFRFTPGTRGWVLTIAAEVLDEVLLASKAWRWCSDRWRCCRRRRECARPCGIYSPSSVRGTSPERICCAP